MYPYRRMYGLILSGEIAVGYPSLIMEPGVARAVVARGSGEGDSTLSITFERDAT